MGPSDMLDYALRQLEGVQFEQFRRAIAADPVLADKAERLAFVLHLLLDDGLGCECRAFGTWPCPEGGCPLERSAEGARVS